MRNTLILFLLTITMLLKYTADGQPLGGAGRMIVPGTHISLTDSSGYFTPTAGAVYIANMGWRLQANQDAVQTPAFNLEHLRNGNLKWYARAYSPSTYQTWVTFVEYYGSSASDESGNTYFLPIATETTYDGDLNAPMNFSQFSLEFSKNWHPLNPLEDDMAAVYITEFWIEVDAAVLPVSFTSLQATIQNGNVLLNWTTLSERNNKSFIVERSQNNSLWENIGSISTKAEQGNSTEKLTYSFSDLKPHEGRNFYRIKQTDIDGKHNYSEVRSLHVAAVGTPKFYPNPANSLIYVDGLSEACKIEILTISGQQLIHLNAKKESQSLDISQLISGWYVLKITKPNEAPLTYKLMKK